MRLRPTTTTRVRRPCHSPASVNVLNSEVLRLTGSCAPPILATSSSPSTHPAASCRCMGVRRQDSTRRPPFVGAIFGVLLLCFAYYHGTIFEGDRGTSSRPQTTNTSQDTAASGPIRLDTLETGQRFWAIRQLAAHHSKSALVMSTNANQGNWRCPTCNQWRRKTAYFCHRCAAEQPAAQTEAYWTEPDATWGAPWKPRRHRSPRPKDQRPLSPRAGAPKGGKDKRGKGKGGQPAQELIAALPPPPPSISSSSVRLEQPPNASAADEGTGKTLETLLAALYKQDKSALTPELQRLLEEQRLSSSKQMTKALHQATTKQGQARKTLQKLRDERVAFLSSWDLYLERLVKLLKQQTEEKERALTDYQTREANLVETIRTAVQDIATLQAAIAEPGTEVPQDVDDSDELMPAPETRDNGFLASLESALQTSKATTKLYSGKRKPAADVEASSEDEQAAKVARAVREGALKRLEDLRLRTQRSEQSLPASPVLPAPPVATATAMPDSGKAP